MLLSMAGAVQISAEPILGFDRAQAFVASLAGLFRSDAAAAAVELERVAHGLQLPAMPQLERGLVLALHHPDVDPDVLGPACSSWLRGHHELIAARTGNAALLPTCSQRPLLIAYLAEAQIAEPWLEDLCRQLRRSLAQAPEDMYVELRIALARQALRCEYAWVPNDEDATVAAIARRRAETSLAHASDAARASRCTLAAVADALSWERLSGKLLSAAAKLSGGRSFEALIREAWTEPEEEIALRAEIPGDRGPPTADLTTRVAEQYEVHPYPRWKRMGAVVQTPLRQSLEALFPSLGSLSGWGPRPRALVAGAGTGAGALRLARAHPETTITAVDLSRASLAHGYRKARDAQLDNIRFMQADLRNLDPALTGYELIECMGVLHHLEDPLGGLLALRERLAPHGLIKLGLYSRRARRAVLRARDYIREQQWQADAEGLRAFRQEILKGHQPTLQSLLETRDFYSLSGLRDLCFHEHETQVTPKALGESLERAGLEVVGVIHHDPTVFRRFRAKFPQPGTERNLSCWDQLEQQDQDLFRAMIQLYVRLKAVSRSRPEAIC